MKASEPLLLASGSPRRHALLEDAGIAHRCSPVDVDETPPAGLSPIRAVVAVAGRKARALAEGGAGSPILAADTMVVLEDEILGKPATPEEARKMLGRLSGRTHRVVTGVVLLDPRRGIVRSRAVESRVTFRALSPPEIEAYVATGEPLDKAGAYAVQGRAGTFVVRLEGSRSNVVGLPLRAVRELLEEDA